MKLPAWSVFVIPVVFIAIYPESFMGSLVVVFLAVRLWSITKTRGPKACAMLS